MRLREGGRIDQNSFSGKPEACDTFATSDLG